MERKKESEKKCSCSDCNKKASFFHSCCGVHFEGIIKEGRLFIACEKCGRIQGELKE